MSTTNKVITTQTLGIFKTQFEQDLEAKVETQITTSVDAKVDEKLEDAGITVDYATEQDILDLFTLQQED